MTNSPTNSAAPSPSELRIRRNDEGRLLVDSGTGEYVTARIIRLFPFTMPSGPVSILNDAGKEIALVPVLHQLPPEQLNLVQAEIGVQEFVTVIQRIVSASSTTLPARWELETNRGPIMITLRDEDAFRNLPGGELLITDAGGTRYLVPSIDALERHSRTILRQHV